MPIKTNPKQTQPVVSLPAVPVLSLPKGARSNRRTYFRKAKMKLNFYSTKDYENQGRLRRTSNRRTKVGSGLLLRLLFRYEQQLHPAAGHSARLLNLSHILQRLNNAIEHCIAVLLVQHLTSAEENGELYLVSFMQEFTSVIQLDVKVVPVGFRTKPNFLECAGVVLVFLMCVANPSFLLVQPFAVIHYTADRRFARWCDFDEV